MSTAAMSHMWLRRQVRQVGGGHFGSPRHVPADSGLADFNAEFEKFAVDAGCAPQRVGHAHLANQITDLDARLGSTQIPRSRSPPPVELEALAIPLDHGCRLHQHHGVQDLRPDPIQPHPKQPIGGEELKATFALSPQDAHLMPKGDEFKFPGGTTSNTEGEQGNEGRKNPDHAHDGMAPTQESLFFFNGLEFWAGTVLPVGQRGARLIPERHPPDWAR
jgi:hypothetical protein